MALVAEQALLGAPTVWASQPIRMAVAFEPEGADTVIQQFGDREVNHGPMIPHPARWLHMSRSFNLRVTAASYRALRVADDTPPIVERDNPQRDESLAKRSTASRWRGSPEPLRIIRHRSCTKRWSAFCQRLGQRWAAFADPYSTAYETSSRFRTMLIVTTDDVQQQRRVV